jgi:hypothetical protein
MFRVITRDFSQEFDRWIDALDVAKSLIPQCKWFQEVRILENGEMVWVYTRSHKYPQFIGAGTYDRLARRFLLETTEAAAQEESDDK